MSKQCVETYLTFTVELGMLSYPDKDKVIHPVLIDAIRDALWDALDNWKDEYEPTFIDGKRAERIILVGVTHKEK
jgi:hypothetical protein